MSESSKIAWEWRNFPQDMKETNLYQGKRAWFLTVLHLCGIFSLPNFFQSPWMNNIHYFVFKQILFNVILCLVVPLVSTSLFLYAIHDLSEFLQRFLEAVLVVSYVGEMVHCNLRLEQLLKLFAHQDRVFRVSNKKIHERYVWIEDLEMKINIVFNVLTVLGVVFETMLPTLDRTHYLMTTIYHRKYPGRVLPFMVWTSSIDTSESRYFYALYLVEVYVCIVFASAIFGVVSLQIIIPTPLVGQYEMLGEFGKMVGKQHKDKTGQNIFYTDVATGQYLTGDQQMKNWLENISTEENNQTYSNREHQMTAMIKFKEWSENVYPTLYLKQVIKRHQELENFMLEYMNLMIQLSTTTIIPFMIVFILSFYQMAYMKNLPLIYCLKIIVEFLFIIVGAWHISTQSESLDRCNEILSNAIYQSHWYKGSPEMKKDVCMVLRMGQVTRHFSLLRGLIKITYKHFLLNIFKTSLSFLNFLKFNGLL